MNQLENPIQYQFSYVLANEQTDKTKLYFTSHHRFTVVSSRSNKLKITKLT